MKRTLFRICLFLWLLQFVSLAECQQVTLTGTLQSSNGLPAQNYAISFKPSQFGFIAGTGVLVNTTTTCATSTDGSVVGVGNPLTVSIVTPAFVGSLPAGNYYIKYAWQDAASHVTLASPEAVVNLTGTGELQVAPPASGAPSTATFMNVYVSTTSGTETYQGQIAAGSVYLQNVALVSGSALPSSNATVCKQVANDAIWPVGTGYTVALVDPNGNTQPGYPMMWQLLGPNTTINLSNGLPYYHGTVTFPVPILASPLTHAQQSISGPLNLAGYNLTGVGSLGVGTNLPGWPIDNETGKTNSFGGFLVNGSGGTSGQCLGSDGTAYDVPVNCLTSTAGIFYQTVLNGAFVANAVTQRAYLAVGSGTGIQATDVLGVGGRPSRTVLSTDSTIPTVGTTSVGQVVCQFAAGPPVVLGHCTSAVNSSGACTCVN